MEKNPVERRELLRRRMMEALENEITVLPRDFQEILVDDLVTAFENRLAVFVRVRSKETEN